MLVLGTLAVAVAAVWRAELSSALLPPAASRACSSQLAAYDRALAHFRPWRPEFTLEQQWEHVSPAQAEFVACVERTCKPLADELAKAKRLHELHSSETTARELVSAESELAACQRLDQE